MRRFLLPVVVLAIVIAASVLATAADDAADSGTGGADGPALATPVLSVRRAPEWLRQPATDANLAAAATAAIGGLGEADQACLSVHRSGTPVVELNATDSLIPGYLQRLATLTAFGNLGSRGFTTDVVRHAGAVVTDGVLAGDLWLVGGADPVLGTDDFIARYGDDRAHTSLETLAADVAAALQAEGITAISGSILGDEAKYEGAEREYGPEYWSREDVASNIAGPISSLLVNNGFESFPAEIDDPANSRANNPAVHAATLLTGLIEAAGITVDGSPAAGAQPDAADREAVASISSPPIADIASRALVDATTAEMLFREVGVRSGRGASQFESFRTVGEQLVEAGVVLPEEVGFTTAIDGSGVSDSDQLRCDVLVNLLDLPDASLAAGALPPLDESILSVCAPDGLESLTALASAREEVTAIAGRAVASNGDELTFAMIVNWAPDLATGALAPRGVCDDAIPALLDAIADHPVGPELDDLGPLDVVSTS